MVLLFDAQDLLFILRLENSILSIYIFIGISENARCATDEGASGHGHFGTSPTGAFKGQLQPEICQDENQTIVSLVHLLLYTCTSMYTT